MWRGKGVCVLFRLHLLSLLLAGTGSECTVVGGSVETAWVGANAPLKTGVLWYLVLV
jgi:hypothetical protein